jgi:hypothetical protein
MPFPQIIVLPRNWQTRETNMKTIRISDAVWKAIADRGKFGETPNMVLERVFGIAKEEPKRAVPREEKKMAEFGVMYNLDELDRVHLLNTKPDQLRIGAEAFQVRNWVDVSLHFVEWLIREGHLRVSDCPVPTARGYKKNFINTEPRHKIPEMDATWNKVDKFFVDVKFEAPYQVENIRRTLRHLSLHDPGIGISFHEV